MLQLEPLLAALDEAGVEFVLIGGVAALAHGSAYLTFDLDICYRREPANYERISRALRPFRPVLRGAPADLPFVLDERTIKAGLNFTLTTEAGDLDLLGEVAGIGGFDAVKGYAEVVELYRRTFWVLGLDGLIIAKRAAGRTKDLMQLPELEALRALRAQTREDEPRA